MAGLTLQPPTNLIFNLFLFFGSEAKLLLPVANGCEFEGAFWSF
jgi:hypothetical protein